MELVGAKVSCARYGKGVIAGISDTHVKVNIDGVIRTFQLETFHEFFTFEDGNAYTLIKEMGEKVKKERIAKEEAEKEAKAKALITGRYDPGYHAEFMSTSEVFTYQEVEEKFGINIAGFGRGCNFTANAIVLISSVDPENKNFVYHDRWDNETDYIFSGEGKDGDQKMIRGNAAIKSAEKDNKEIHLFIKESPQKYYYQGIFKLIEFWIATDKGSDGKDRQEYKFRLRRV